MNTPPLVPPQPPVPAVPAVPAQPPQSPVPAPVNWNWWPQFHDSSLRLSWQEQVCIHWDANLRMLRDWSACWTFFGISVLPFPLLVIALLIAQGGLQSVNGIPTGVDGWFYVGMVLLAVYLYVQHVAFMVAMGATSPLCARHSPLVGIRPALPAGISSGHRTRSAPRHLPGMRFRSPRAALDFRTFPAAPLRPGSQAQSPTCAFAISPSSPTSTTARAPLQIASSSHQGGQRP